MSRDLMTGRQCGLKGQGCQAGARMAVKTLRQKETREAKAWNGGGDMRQG